MAMPMSPPMPPMDPMQAPMDPAMANVIPMPPPGLREGNAPSRARKSAIEERRKATKLREAEARSDAFALPITEDSEFASFVRQLFYDARQAKRSMMQQWNVNYQFLRNRPQTLPISSRAAALVPEIFPIIASKVGWKMDRRVINTVSSAAIPHSAYWADTSDLAADLATVLDAIYQVNGEEGEIAKSLWDAEIYGTGFLKTAWHPELAGGLGDAMTTRVDPYTVYPDPAARSMDDMNHIMEVRTMSLQEADRRWPGAATKLREAPFIEQAAEAPDQMSNRQTVPRANPGAISPATVPRYGMVGGGFLSATNEPGVTVIEAWLREHYTITDDEAPFGYRTVECWRCVVVCGNVILMDEKATNLWSHGGHPYTRYVTADIGEFWGFSTVELLIPTQRSINRMLDALITNIEITGNPTLVDDVRAGISRTSATNKPGQRLTINQGKVEWLKPPPMNQMQPEMVRYMLQRMEIVSGMAAIIRGGTPSGRNAQGVMDTMAEAAFVRIRMELIQLQLSLTNAGKLKASLVVENYTEERNMAILGDDGAKKMLEIQPRHFLIPTLDGEMPLEYTLLVDAGAREHTGRKAREDQVMGLANMGMIDAQAVLEALEFPGRNEILKRLAAAREQEMAMGIDPNKK